MHSRRLAAVALAAALATATSSLAAAPAPKKSIDLDRFMGRWNEILRTPNDAQKNCYAAYQVWSQPSPGRFNIAQVCHKDSPAGPEKRIQTGARVLDPPTNAKFEASFFAGLIHRDYWVLDHADDYSWMIASTADGKFVGILARKASLPRAEVDTLRSRASALGLNGSELVASNAGAD